jgi:hypothetical protein
LKPAQANSSGDPILKIPNIGGVAQVKALSSSLSTTGMKEREELGKSPKPRELEKKMFH